MLTKSKTLKFDSYVNFNKGKFYTGVESIDENDLCRNGRILKSSGSGNYSIPANLDYFSSSDKNNHAKILVEPGNYIVTAVGWVTGVKQYQRTDLKIMKISVANYNANNFTSSTETLEGGLRQVTNTTNTQYNNNLSAIAIVKVTEPSYLRAKITSSQAATGSTSIQAVRIG